MRLTKENIQNKNEKKKINKNKSLIEEKTNIKYKIENPYLQEKIKKYNNDLAKEKLKEKNFKDSRVTRQFQSNTNIYKNNNKILNKINSQIGKDIEKNSIYTKNNTISLNTNNNINIGNNINIITNNHIHENNNNRENKLRNNLINNRGIMTDYNLTKKNNINEIYNNNLNNITNQINDNIRLNRIKVDTENANRKYKGKNSSVENRSRRLNKEVVMSDGELMTDEVEDNLEIRRNHIYSNPFKYKSPVLFYNNNKNNDNNLINNNKYFYSKDYENYDEGGETFYNNFYKLKYTKKSFINNNRNKYNSLIDYNDKNNKYSYTNDIQNKTSNSFYIHKSHINTNNINKNIITNRDYSNDIDDNDDNIYTSYMNYVSNKRGNKVLRPKGKYHSMIEENDFPSPDRNYANTNNNYIDNKNYNPNEYKSIRRSKNRIRIVKKNNNSSIQEYNLSLGEDNEIDYYQNDFMFENKNRMNYNSRKNNDLKDYYNHFSKNLQPIKNNQFNINSNINNSKRNLTNDKYSSNSINNMNNINKENIINNSKSSNILISTPNFSDSGKTPKRQSILSNHKVKPFNNNNDTNINDNNNSNSINNSNNDENNSQYKIIVKKRPKNDIPIPTNSIKRKNSSNSSNKNFNKIINNNFEICNNEKINFFPNFPKKEEKIEKNKNKFIFDNENEMIDYIYTIYNKFEEERKKKSYFNRKLRFTGFVLSKKYKGKNLYDIRIEDDIDKINQQLKDEQVFINDKKVELKFIDENENENKQNINNNINIYSDLI